MSKWSETIPAGLGAVGRFLTADERHGLATMPVRMLAIVDDPANRFGPRWVVSLAYLDTGEKVALGLKRNPVRDGQMEAGRKALADGEVFDPMICEVVETKAGNETYSFRDATDAEIAAIVAMTGAGSLAALLAIEPWSEDDEADAAAAEDGEPIAGQKLGKGK